MKKNFFKTGLSGCFPVVLILFFLFLKAAPSFAVSDYPLGSIPDMTVTHAHSINFFFHWDDQEIASHELDLSRLGLDPDSRTLGYDFWQGKELAPCKEKLQIDVPPRSVRLLCLRKALNRPQLLSTNRHFTQGAVAVKAIEWKEDKGRLQGRCQLISGFPLHLFLHVPSNFAPTSHSENVQYSIDETLMTVKVKEGSGFSETWWIDFAEDKIGHEDGL